MYVGNGTAKTRCERPDRTLYLGKITHRHQLWAAPLNTALRSFPLKVAGLLWIAWNLSTRPIGPTRTKSESGQIALENGPGGGWGMLGALWRM